MRRKTLTDRFRALHVPGRPLVMPNPWDLGSAKLMAGLGAQALATTSAGHGFTFGLADGGWSLARWPCATRPTSAPPSNCR